MPAPKKVSQTSASESETLDMYSEGWTEKLVGELTPEEQDDKGNPVYRGLKRLAQKYYGEVVANRITGQQFPSEENNFCSGVVRSITFKTLSGELHTVDDIAAVSNANSDGVYLQFGPESASTRAESRIFRKVLNLNIIASEETTSVVAENAGLDGYISSTQIRSLKVLGKRYNINIGKYINMGDYKYENPNRIAGSVAEIMIKHINKLGQDENVAKEKGKQSPIDKLDIRGYEDGWDTVR